MKKISCIILPKQEIGYWLSHAKMRGYMLVHFHLPNRIRFVHWRKAEGSHGWNVIQINSTTLGRNSTKIP